jgi:nucleoside-triphosphatase THEP1
MSLDSHNAKILVLTGESGAGKTRICEHIVTMSQTSGVDVAGVLTLPRWADAFKVGMDVRDIRTHESRPLAERAPAGDSPIIENWHFDSTNLEWGATVLRRATPCDLLVIDELGPLEFCAGKGWVVGIDLLATGDYARALVVVRPTLLSNLYARLAGAPCAVFTATRSNHAELLTQMTPLCGLGCLAGRVAN